MPAPNSIKITSDGNITIQDVEAGSITINTHDPAEILVQLQRLNQTQLDSLLQVAEQQNQALSDLFRTLLNGVAQQKNVVKGSISNVQTVRIGDEIHYHYHTAETRLPKELTNYIPKTHPDDIIGRENDLDELHTLLQEQKRVVVVNGMGGIGKTTLAQAYLSKYYDDYHHIAWITQSSDNLATDFINAGGLAENLNVTTAGLEPEKLVQEIIRGLKTIPNKPNLLTIDNAEQSVKQYLNLLPGQPHWHLLLTSREDIAGFYRKRLDFLSEEQALALFKKHYTLRHLSEQEIKDLLAAVDYHTLTIEVLAKTAQVQRYDAATLKQAIERDLRANTEVSHRSSTVDKVGTYLRSVFTLSRLTEPELWLLKQFTCLPPEFHTYDLLHDLLIAPESPYADVFAETLTELVKKGWLLQNGETDSFKMHRIITEVVKAEHPTSPADVSQLIEAVTQQLNIDQTKDNPVDKFAWIPFGRALLIHFADDTSADISRLQNNLSLVLKALGDYAGARDLLEKALRSAERNFGPDHPNTVIISSNLASALKELGEYRKACWLLEKALRADEKNLGPNHPTTVSTSSNLASVLIELGEYEKARQLLEKALHSAQQNFGPDHPTTARISSNLALVLQELGDYQEARILLEKALRSDEKNFGSNHPNTTRSASNLATVLKAIGDYEGARQLLEKALQSDEKNFGPNHPTTAVSYSNLALVLKDLGNYEGARQLLKKALQSDEKNLGPDHPITAVRYSNLGSVLQGLGEYEEARQLLEKALHSAQQNFGPDHPTTALRYSNLASLLIELGDYQEARILLEKALRSDEKNFGSNHPNTARSASNLAMVFKELGNYKDAVSLLGKALQANEKNFGPNHPTTAVSYSNLGSILKDLGEYASARFLLEKALQSNEENFGSNHLTTARSAFNLAFVLKTLNEYEEALKLTKKVLTILKKVLPPDHPRIQIVAAFYQSIKDAMV